MKHKTRLSQCCGILFFILPLLLLLLTSCDIPERFRDASSGFTYRTDQNQDNDLKFVNVKILLPANDIYLFYSDGIQEAADLLSSKAEQALNCSVTVELKDMAGYEKYLETAAASGIPYDIAILKPGGTNENPREYEFHEEEFWYADWVNKGLIKDITEEISTYFPKGLEYIERLPNAKSYDDRIYAVPKLFKSFRVYGALCTPEVIKNYGSNKIHTYEDFIRLIDTNLEAGVDLNINLAFCQLLDIYLQDVSMIRLIAGTVYDTTDRSIHYIEDTDIADVVINQYKKYYDTGILERQPDDDIYVTDYRTFKFSEFGNNQDPYFAKTAADDSLLLIGGGKNDVFYWYSISAAAIFTTSPQTERALMLLDFINSGNEDITDILQFGVKDKHYKKSQDKKIDLLEVGTVFWGESLMNYESEAIVFSFEENADEWKECLLNTRVKEIVPGVPNQKIFQLYKYLPEEMKQAVRKRTSLSDITFIEYFKEEDGVNVLLAKMRSEQNEQLLDAIYRILMEIKFSLSHEALR